MIPGKGGGCMKKPDAPDTPPQTRRTLAVNVAMGLLYLCILIVLYVLKVPCLFRTLTGYPCPGCGMTRATLCALHGDWVGAFQNHAMFWAMPFLGFSFLLPGRFLNSRWGVALLIFLGAGFLGNWIVHLLGVWG